MLEANARDDIENKTTKLTPLQLAQRQCEKSEIPWNREVLDLLTADDTTKFMVDLL